MSNMEAKITCYVILWAMVAFLVSASDPVPLQNFCVAVNHSILKQPFYQDPKFVKVNDFIFTGLNIPKNISNPIGSVATLFTVYVFPGLNILGIGFARIDFAINGLNSPHIHPHGSEILTVLESTLYAGFVTYNPDNQLFTKVLHPGNDFVFPIGFIHFQHNIGNTTPIAYAAFSSQNSGIDIANPVFDSMPLISNDVLTKVFQVDENVISNLQAQFIRVKNTN